MKTLSIFLLGILTAFLIGCSGSNTYRGSWKATDLSGSKFEIVFDAKSFSVTDSSGKKANYDYVQNQVNMENSVETYGIRLGDGREYKINFPRANDVSIGVIKDDSGNPVYAISRTEYVLYNDVFKLN